MIKNFFSLVTFSHVIFALPFAFIGYFLAERQAEYYFDVKILVFIVLCMIFARNSAMAFNRWLDWEIDRKNPRTSNREIPKGIIKPKSALLFVIFNSLCFVVTTYFINNLVFLLSFVALAVILGYSYTKRFTALCHIILGLGLSLAPIGAYLAVSEQFALTPVLFSFIVVLWVSGFDIIYSLQDETFDRSENLKSIPSILGRKNALIVSAILHAFSLFIIGYLAVTNTFGLWFKVGGAIFGVLLIYQHTIVKVNDLSKVNLAFFTTNGVASIIFAIFTIFDLFFKI